MLAFSGQPLASDRRSAVGDQISSQSAIENRQSAIVKILDLGLALLETAPADGEEMTLTGAAMGTLDYMAPEQTFDAHDVDIRADIYSLGCTLHKLLTGHAPFSGPEYPNRLARMMARVQDPVPPIRERREDVPDEMVGVLDRMLAKERNDRFATPADVAVALEPFTAGCDLAGLLAKATGATPAPAGPAQPLAPTDEYRSSALVETGTKHKPGAERAVSPARAFQVPKIPVAIGLVVLAFLAFGIIFYLCGGRQTVKVEIDPKLIADSSITVWLDGRQMEIAGLGETIELKPGTYGYEIRRGDEVIAFREFTVLKGDNPALRISVEEAAPPPPPEPAEPPGETLELGESWKPGPADNILPGIVPRPALLPGIGRWQVETVAPRGAISAVDWSPDGRLIACGTSVGLVWIYDGTTLQLVRLLVGHGSEVWSVAWSPDGQWLASGSVDCQAPECLANSRRHTRHRFPDCATTDASSHHHRRRRNV